MLLCKLLADMHILVHVFYGKRRCEIILLNDIFLAVQIEVLSASIRDCGRKGLNVDSTYRRKIGHFIYAILDLAELSEEDQITVVGNGSACVVGGHAYIIKKGQRFISNSAIASMGYDLPAAIGAHMANRDDPEHVRDVILLTGDGSIMMNLQELQTIIHAKMPIKIFLINNDGYHSIRQTERNFYGDQKLVGIGSDSGDVSFPDFGKLAEALGFPYVRALHNSELAGAIESALAMEGPVICEMFVDTDQNFEPKSSGKRMPDGTIVSPPLEDLVPFLPDEEMDANMIVPRMKQ